MTRKRRRSRLSDVTGLKVKLANVSKVLDLVVEQRLEALKRQGVKLEECSTERQDEEQVHVLAAFLRVVMRRRLQIKWVLWELSYGTLSTLTEIFAYGIRIKFQKKVPLVPLCQQARTFASSRPRQITGQEAPSAQAYLSSGVLGGYKNLIDVKKVIVIGSGGLSIGQAGEFDYSGSQALKALKEAKVASVLINPNIATIQTDHKLADEVYYLPVTPEYVTHVIERERPDGILLTFGGQTALNLGVKMEEMGIFERYNVKVLGTSINTLKTSEDRDLFAKALQEINIPIAESIAVSTVDEALAAAKKIGYPIISRSAYALGGLGSGFASDEEELQNLSSRSLTLSPQILIEKSLKGWKELEYEV
ncbi:MAG: hypothetical protein L6R42_010288, partial [Xanthoria sp. 1 TBL-2021]